MYWIIYLNISSEIKHYVKFQNHKTIISFLKMQTLPHRTTVLKYRKTIFNINPYRYTKYAPSLQSIQLRNEARSLRASRKKLLLFIIFVARQLIIISPILFWIGSPECGVIRNHQRMLTKQLIFIKTGATANFKWLFWTNTASTASISNLLITKIIKL